MWRSRAFSSAAAPIVRGETIEIFAFMEARMRASGRTGRQWRWRMCWRKRGEAVGKAGKVSTVTGCWSDGVMGVLLKCAQPPTLRYSAQLNTQCSTPIGARAIRAIPMNQQILTADVFGGGLRACVFCARAGRACRVLDRTEGLGEEALPCRIHLTGRTANQCRRQAPAVLPRPLLVSGHRQLEKLRARRVSLRRSSAGRNKQVSGSFIADAEHPPRKVAATLEAHHRPREGRLVRRRRARASSTGRHRAAHASGGPAHRATVMTWWEKRRPLVRRATASRAIARG